MPKSPADQIIFLLCRWPRFCAETFYLAKEAKERQLATLNKGAFRGGNIATTGKSTRQIRAAFSLGHSNRVRLRGAVAEELA